MNNIECLEKALEYTRFVNNCCNKVDRCIFTNHCYCFDEISECEEHEVFMRIKNALEAEPVKADDTAFTGDAIPVEFVEDIISMAHKLGADSHAESLEILIKDWEEMGLFK